jgi:DNA-binding NarL/FixJ family response regulator
MSDNTRIAIADDHQLVLDGLKAMLGQVEGFEVVGEANNGSDLVRIVENIEVDVALTDIDMPVMNGIEAIKEIRKTDREIKLLALTMHNEKALVQKVIEAGADGYMLKNADRDEFIEAIRKVIEGQQYFSSEVTMTLLDKGAPTAGTEHYDLSQLTEREIEILKLVAEGLSNKEIGERLFISHRTVDTHRTNLMKKLDVHNVAGLIRFAMKNGLI